MTDRDAFWAAVEAAPRDAAPKLAFADWLEDDGADRCALDDERVAYGLRWCAYRGRHPFRRKDGACTWRIGDPGNQFAPRVRPHFLPAVGPLRRLIPGGQLYGVGTHVSRAVRRESRVWPAIETAFWAIGNVLLESARVAQLVPESKAYWFPVDSPAARL